MTQVPQALFFLSVEGAPNIAVALFPLPHPSLEIRNIGAFGEIPLKLPGLGMLNQSKTELIKCFMAVLLSSTRSHGTPQQGQI